ncbi:MAG TPA: CYCXC family (seleno)protein [Longimicrobiales bacterium]|nr:CYCXC family (seleno)protein [Longimicrobiales bacterium]
MAEKLRTTPGPLAAARRRQRRAWLVAAVSVAAFVTVSMAVPLGFGRHTHHPAPRTATAQPQVVPSTRFSQWPRVAQTYQLAAATPMILDGLYCYCRCSEHSGHYSLLDCFASDHAARCDVCMSEAVIGYQMSRNGASLDAIRAEVDRTYGS